MREYRRLAETLASTTEHFRAQQLPFEQLTHRVREQQEAFLRASALAGESARALSDISDRVRHSGEFVRSIAPTLIPLDRLASQITEQLRWREELARHAARAVEPFKALSERLTAPIAAYQDLQTLINNRIELIESLRTSWSVVINWQSALHQIKTTETLAVRLAGITGIVASDARLSGNEASQLSEAIHHEIAIAIYAAQHDKNSTEGVDVVSVGMRVASALVSRFRHFGISASTLLQMIFTILLAYQLSTDTSLSAEGDWQKVTSDLYEVIDLQTTANAGPIDGVITRPAKLRVAPHGKAQSIAELDLNEEVHLIDESGKWYLVSVFDHSLGMRTGWVFSRNIRLVDKSTSNDGNTESSLRGERAKESALRLAGGALSVTEVAELLETSVAGVKQRQRRGSLLAVPLSNGEWGYPARQFSPDGRLRSGLKAVLAAFMKDEDPWVILSFLTNPVSGEAVAFDALDDPEATRALVEVARTFWEQGAT